MGTVPSTAQAVGKLPCQLQTLRAFHQSRHLGHDSNKDCWPQGCAVAARSQQWQLMPFKACLPTIPKVGLHAVHLIGCSHVTSRSLAARSLKNIVFSFLRLCKSGSHIGRRLQQMSSGPIFWEVKDLTQGRFIQVNKKEEIPIIIWPYCYLCLCP